MNVVEEALLEDAAVDDTVKDAAKGDLFMDTAVESSGFGVAQTASLGPCVFVNGLCNNENDQQIPSSAVAVS